MSVLSQVKTKKENNYSLSEVCFIFLQKDSKQKVKQIAEALTKATGTKRTAHAVSYKIRWINKHESFHEIFTSYGETYTGKEDIEAQAKLISDKLVSTSA